MTADRHMFSPLQRALHWLMALMVLAMLFIGVTMVSTLKPRFLTLIAIHKPLGIAILVLALLRLGMRFRRGAPPLPPDLPSIQAFTHYCGPRTRCLPTCSSQQSCCTSQPRCFMR
jgi:cytochrome b561